jgi:hypothetical protein
MSDRDTLLRCLELEWNDHFQTRVQTWKTLEIEAVIALGVVGIDVRIDSAVATTAAALLLVIATTFGVLITLRHRKVEQRKFAHILRIEEELGVRGEGKIFDDVEEPKPVRLIDAVRINKSNTNLFILRMHLTLMAFGILYGIARLSVQ